MLKLCTVSDMQIYTAIKRDQYFNHNVLACFFSKRFIMTVDYFAIFIFKHLMVLSNIHILFHELQLTVPNGKY